MNFTDSSRSTARKIPVRNGNNYTQVAPATPPAENQPASTPPLASTAATSATAPEPDTDWQTVALRLQADMDNFRKRQQRRADEAIAGERERLLQLMLPIADNLTRALNHDDQHEEPLRQGVELIRRELMRLLTAEGVTLLETVGQPFDPQWHEAVALAPVQAEPGTIVQEVEAGYKLGDKLLRPARVVVAA